MSTTIVLGSGGEIVLMNSSGSDEISRKDQLRHLCRIINAVVLNVSIDPAEYQIRIKIHTSEFRNE